MFTQLMEQNALPDAATLDPSSAMTIDNDGEVA